MHFLLYVVFCTGGDSCWLEQGKKACVCVCSELFRIVSCWVPDVSSGLFPDLLTTPFLDFCTDFSWTYLECTIKLFILFCIPEQPVIIAGSVKDFLISPSIPDLSLGNLWIQPILSVSWVGGHLTCLSLTLQTSTGWVISTQSLDLLFFCICCYGKMVNTH